MPLQLGNNQLGDRDNQFDHFHKHMTESEISAKMSAVGLTESSKKYVYQVISKTPSTKSPSSQSTIGRALLWLSTPFRAALRIFSPSVEQLLDQRIADLNQAFSNKLKPNEVKLAIKSGHPLNHDEMKELMVSWLFSSLKESITEAPLNRIYHLLNELADSDVPSNVREAMKHELNELAKAPKVKQQFPHLPSAISSFIHIFNEEKKAEDLIAPLPTKEYLEKLLVHPNLLKRSDVADFVSKMPESALKQRVLDKMNTVLSRVLQKAHEQENELLNALPNLLQELSFEDLKQKYSSTTEKDYLTSRLQVVDQKIKEDKSLLGSKEDFNLRILQFEKKHLEEQINSMEKAQAVLDTIDETTPKGSAEIIENANEITTEEIEKVRAMLKKRVEGALPPFFQAVSFANSTKIRDQLKALTVEYDSLMHLDNRQFLTQAIPFTKKLQHLESELLRYSPVPHNFLAQTNEHVAEFTGIKTHLDTVHTLSPPWKDISTVKTNEQRKLERQDGLTRDVIRLCLEKIPTCQLPLRLAGMDARVYETPPLPGGQVSALDANLQKHAHAFIESVQAKYLESVKTKLFSLREYTTDMREQQLNAGLNPVRDEVEKGEMNRFNFEQFAHGLDLTEPLHQWHSDLQQVWVEHIPSQQEEEILAISSNDKRLQKMETCFSTWLWAKTHTKLMDKLSFEGIQIKDLSAQRKAQFKKIAPVVRKFRGEDTILQKKEDAASQPVAKTKKASLIELSPPNFNVQTLGLKQTEYHEMDTGSPSLSNPIKELQEAHKRIFGDPPQPITLEIRGEWIRELAKNPRLHSLAGLRSTLITECKELARASFDVGSQVPTDVQEIFINQYRVGDQKKSPLDFSNLNNLERRNFLAIFLQQTFADNKILYGVSNQQRYYLIQFCALSGLPKAHIETILNRIQVDHRRFPPIPSFNNRRLPPPPPPSNQKPSTPTLSDIFSDVGSKLQESSIGLEGIEESALQKSFQKSNLPRTPETRSMLDFWRARTGNSLQPHLFKYSIDIQDKSHDQGREAIARAIYHAFQAHPEQGKAYLDKLLSDPAVNADAFNAETLAPPLRIFYLDCLLSLFPADPNALQELQTFNEGLIKTKNVGQMVTGFSREIARLSNELLQLGSLSDKDFAKLLKYKLTYQELKLKHFHNKKEITGFLRGATEAAETAMISSATAIQNKLAEPGYSKTIQSLLLENVFNEEVVYADVFIKSIFKDYKDVSLENDLSVPGYLSLGESIEIDGVLGILYFDGEQKISLPGHLQNHPDMRALNIHALPYSRDVPGGPFIYYTTVSGKKEAQISVTELDGEPVIHKKLPTTFDASKQSEQLQFVSKEALSLPYAIEHRMGIKSFWIDASKTLYGFDDKGDLAVILNRKLDTKTKGLDRWVLKLKDEKEYSILTLKEISTHKEHPVLKRLLTSFNPNEILVNWEKESFLIPALGLTFTKKQDSLFQNPVWKCECKGIAGKILDTEAPASSRLALKNEPNKNKIETITKDLKLAKKQLENEQVPGLSRVNKQKVYRLEREITRLNHALEEAEGHILLTTFPEESFEQAASVIQRVIKDLIPPELDIRGELTLAAKQNAEQLTYGFEVYPFILDFLRAQLKEAYTLAQKDSRLKVQERYTNLQLVYKTVRDDGERSCNRQPEKVTFKSFRNGSIASNDLSGALSLILNSNKNPLEIIQELAKYPLIQPLTDSQFELLSKASKHVKESSQHAVGESKFQIMQLDAYLSLLEHQQLAFQMEELAHSTLSDKMETVEHIEKAFAENEDYCNTLLGRISATLSKLPSSVSSKLRHQSLVSPEVLALWKKTNLAPQQFADLFVKDPQAVVSTDKPGKALVTHELIGLTQETLLERFSATNQIASTSKDPQAELSPQHKSLIKSFQKHSPDQVAGFYLEELGRFDLAGLRSEFRIDKDTGHGLYGITEKHLDRLFDFLKKEKYITQKGQDSYYSLTAPEYATTSFNKDQVRASMADLPLSEIQMQHITERLQTYLFKAMQAGFKFSFKDKKVEAELMQKLEQEKETHLQKYLDAEAIIEAKMAPYGISLVDVKYAVLSGNYQNLLNKKGSDGKSISMDELPALRNALSLYLFHKTEVQHIENILKAPNLGERNKIELLQTRRNYSVDKLLQEGLTGKEREEQTIQRAFLVYEEDYGFRCNAMQIKMFRSLLLNSDDAEAVDAVQARMGFGKTALLPILAIVRISIERDRAVEDKHLVRYVVPRAVIEDNTSSFNQRLLAITGGNVFKDRDFTRYQIDKKEPEHSFDLIITDLNKRLALYKEARSQGNVLIQWPEIRGSMEAQDLDFGEMIVQGGLSEEALEKCMESKRLLGEIRSISTYTIFDELDDTQDLKSREVNYTRGEKTPIPVTTIRPMEKMISFVAKQDDWKDTRVVAKKMLQEVVGIDPAAITNDLINYVTNRNVALDEKILPFLTPALHGFLQGKEGSKAHTEKDSALFLVRAILLDPNMLALAKNKQPNTHFGARFVEREGKRVYFHDPDSQSPLLIAVPYEGTNTPKGLSIFDNTEVAGITTLRYYLSKETLFSTSPHLDFLIKQVRRKTIPTDLSTHYLKNVKNEDGKTPIDQLKEMVGMLDEEELKQAKEKFHADFLRNPTEDFRHFFGMAVVATQIRSDAASAKSDRYERGSPDNVEKGCSGTVGGTSSYFAKQETDAAADGKLSLEIMGRANNAAVKTLSAPRDNEDYLEEILTTLLANSDENTRAIIDTAGICKSKDGTPETVVARLFDHIRNNTKMAGIEGIVYYGKDNVKRLYRGPNLPPIPCSTAMELAALDGKKYFSFYGQKNTRGSDIKQANGVHSLVTIDENVLNSDAKQAVLRFRNLVNRDSGQTFSFAFMPGYTKILKDALKVDASTQLKAAAEEEAQYQTSLTQLRQTLQDGGLSEGQVAEIKEKIKRGEEALTAINTQITTLKSKVDQIDKITIEAKEVANYLRLQEKELEEKEALAIFRKEMSAHIKQAAAHLEHDILRQLQGPLDEKQKRAYQDFLVARSKISSFVENSIDTLYQKYGTATHDQNRDNFIAAQKILTTQKLQELFRAGTLFSEAVESPITLKEEIYTKQIDRSIAFFKKRFEENTPVQVTAVNAGAMAVAQALAEALAQAEAEGVAEKLSENVVEVLDRYVPPLLETTKEDHLNVSLDFLQQGALRHPVKELPRLQVLIKPSLRDLFEVSDLVFKQNIVSHFILAKKGAPYVFITQEEGDLFASFVETHQETHGYALYDARTLSNIPDADKLLDKDNAEIKQVICAVIGSNGVPQAPVSNMEQLRATSLTNVDTDQLLPHLRIETETKDLLQRYVTLEQFGVANNTRVNLDIKPVSVDKKIEISVGCGPNENSITIPQTNQCLNKHITDVYNEQGREAKMLEVQRRVREEYESIPGIKDFEKQKAALEVKMAGLKKILVDPNIGNFDVTADMQRGLDKRDAEYSGGVEGTYGRLFTEGLDKIKVARQLVKNDPSPSNLKILNEAFNSFIDPQILSRVTASNYKSTPLMSASEWNSHFFAESSLTPLELVYGRILYTVHSGNISGASGCSRQDCHCMFNETLPALIKAVKKLTDVMTKIEEMEKQAQQIATEIDKIKGQMPSGLVEAHETMKHIIVEQSKIEKNLENRGVRFSGDNQFFDHFQFQDFQNWKDPASAQVHSVLPDYKDVVQQGIEQGFLGAMRAPTEEEQTVIQQNNTFLRDVLGLSKQLAARKGEVLYV